MRRRSTRTGDQGTQIEFFHTFNSLYDAQKQNWMSSTSRMSVRPEIAPVGPDWGKM